MKSLQNFVAENSLFFSIKFYSRLSVERLTKHLRQNKFNHVMSDHNFRAFLRTKRWNTGTRMHARAMNADAVSFEVRGLSSSFLDALRIMIKAVRKGQFRTRIEPGTLDLFINQFEEFVNLPPYVQNHMPLQRQNFLDEYLAVTNYRLPLISWGKVFPERSAFFEEAALRYLHRIEDLRDTDDVEVAAKAMKAWLAETNIEDRLRRLTYLATPVAQTEVEADGRP